MTKAKMVVVGAIIAAGAATPITLQYRSNQQLKAELEALRSQLDAQPAPQATAGDSQELQRQRREHDELMRLRGEVALLRQKGPPTGAKGDSNDLEKLKNVQLFKLARDAAEAQALLAKSPEIPMLPAKSWTHSGFSNPATALQTLNWAVANRDTNAFLNGIAWDPQVRARAEELFAGLPEDARQRYGSLDGIIEDWLLGRATPIAAFRVLSQSEQGNGEVSLLEQHQYTDDRVRENTVQFHQDENGNWRQVIPQDLLPKIEHVINNAAGIPTASSK